MYSFDRKKNTLRGPSARGASELHWQLSPTTMTALRANSRHAREVWGCLSRELLRALNELGKTYRLSVAAGDVQLLDGRWYVTHAGLLRLAFRQDCIGICSFPDRHFCEPDKNRWIFKAVVYRLNASKTFVGYGDADPSNVSPLVHGAEMRVAETRAGNRALRKAYGIGLCSVEDLGYVAPPSPRAAPIGKVANRPTSNGNGTCNGQPRLRDRLSLLIRQHQLDPAAVKLFAAEFCGTHELREASREMVESFIQHLAEWASKDRDGLVCKLNSYATPAEVRP
jgi:hypothetical protein